MTLSAWYTYTTVATYIYNISSCAIPLGYVLTYHAIHYQLGHLPIKEMSNSAITHYTESILAYLPELFSRPNSYYITNHFMPWHSGQPRRHELLSNYLITVAYTTCKHFNNNLSWLRILPGKVYQGQIFSLLSESSSSKRLRWSKGRHKDS
jgi:hypothetical protein